jgi:death-on-curing protein
VIFLTVGEIITLHSKLIAATGGNGGLLNMGILESAVLNCCQTFDGEDLYPGVIEKAARLAFCVCANHPFVDGNKRVAVAALLTILRLNDVVISYTRKELVALGLAVADGSLDYKDIVEWIRSRLSPADANKPQ